MPLDWVPQDDGFDAVIGSEINSLRYYTAKYFEDNGLVRNLSTKIKWKLGFRPNADVETRDSPIVVEYAEAAKYLVTEREFPFEYFPLLVPNWDNTPRAGNNGLVFNNSTPELWKSHLRDGMRKVRHLPPEHRIVMIKSWNEWAEGNYLEPDTRFGHQYLAAIREALEEEHDL
jgi:hypothetical protein